MKRFLIAVSLVLMASAAKAEGSIGDVLKQIAQNNLTLKALHHEGEAEVLDIKAANAPGGLSVEYSPFFRSGYSGRERTRGEPGNTVPHEICRPQQTG